MAFQNFWFPSQTTGYTTAAGSLRFNIKYDSGAGAANTNVGADLQELSSLDMPFEVDPSGSGFRHPAMSMTFINKPYDAINNIFEQYSILNETYKTELFVDMYIDGSIFWKGIVDFDKIKRTEYYVDGSDLKYRTIKLNILDRLAYFWMNNALDLTDISFADYDLLSDTIEAIFALIDVAPAEINYDAALGAIDEASSGNSYDYTDLMLVNIVTSTLLKDFIKNFMLSFACWVYSYNGKYYIALRNAGSTKAIDNDKIAKGSLEKIENANPIEYVDCDAVIDWESKVPYGMPGNSYQSVTHQKTYGDPTVDTSRRLGLTLTELLDYLCVIYPGTSTDVDDEQVPTDAGDTFLEDTNLGNPPDFFSYGIETGHFLDYYSGGGNYYAPITAVPDEFNVNFPDKDLPPDVVSYYYIIHRNPGVNDYEEYIFKAQKLLENAAAIYDDFFLTSPDVIRVRLRDISEYINIHYRFQLFGNNHRIRNAKINFNEDNLSMELLQVT